MWNCTIKTKRAFKKNKLSLIENMEYRGLLSK